MSEHKLKRKQVFGKPKHNTFDGGPPSADRIFVDLHVFTPGVKIARSQ